MNDLSVVVKDVLESTDLKNIKTEIKEINLKIEGMRCAGCSTRLEKVLNNLEGVETAKVSLEEKKATIKYDETKINIENIKEAIEDAGFKGE